MTATLDAFISAFVYISTAIATLRAGSRALYITRHDGAIGIMDGPLILGPEDVMEIKKNPGNKSQEEVDGVEVSELWESTYGFQKAVKLSLLGTVYSQGGSLTSGERFDVVTVGNIAVENRKRYYYSLASPHKNFPAQDDLSIKDEDYDGKTEGELDEKASKSVSSITFWGRGIHALQTSLLPLKSRVQPSAPPNNMLSEMIDSDPISIQSIHQSLIDTNTRNNKHSSKQGEGECDDEILDCSTVLSSIIPIPSTTPEDEDEDDEIKQRDIRGGTVPSQRVARIKAYAPNVFSSLRSRFGIEEDDFAESIMSSGPYVSFQSNSKGAARSGKFGLMNGL